MATTFKEDSAWQFVNRQFWQGPLVRGCRWINNLGNSDGVLVCGLIIQAQSVFACQYVDHKFRQNKAARGNWWTENVGNSDCAWLLLDREFRQSTVLRGSRWITNFGKFPLLVVAGKSRISAESRGAWFQVLRVAVSTLPTSISTVSTRHVLLQGHYFPKLEHQTQAPNASPADHLSLPWHGTAGMLSLVPRLPSSPLYHSCTRVPSVKTCTPPN